MTRRRFDLTDFEWSIIQPLLPNKQRGVPRVGDRRVINGILWRFRTAPLGRRSRSIWSRIPHATTGSRDGAKRVSVIMFWARFPKLSMAISS